MNVHTAPSPPIFVFGALRSGTTVFRLMLNAHDGIYNPGEVDFLFDFLHPDPTHPSGWKYNREALENNRIFLAHELVLPEEADGLDLLGAMIAQFRDRAAGQVLTMNIHRHADLAAETLPEASFVHLLRDPRDVARSSVGMGWAGLSYYGVDHWIETERGWQQAAIPASRTLTLKFEDLMADLEPRLTEVCAFLGVPFSARMLNYHLNTTYGPPNPALAEQWRRKASPREIALLESKCGGMITALGYSSGGAAHHPGPVERTALHSRNTLLRWRKSIDRFGLPLLVATKLSRWLGARRWHQSLRRRKDARIARHLK